jgi:nucleoside-diphosphate-sugar epimerase
MEILLMGGTRFIGKPLVQQLIAAGHQLCIFTRGREPIPAGVEHLRGDRSVDADLALLKGRKFEVIIDSSGRSLADTQTVLAQTAAPTHRFIYVSSAGVYAASELWPLDEESPLDPASRHAGKAHTEAWLRQQGIPFTSFRPTYIYGPGNYNPIESWFFDRICQGLPVPLPGDGSTITQLGHVDDLAHAMARSLEVDAATNRIYNCTGRKGVTFKGLVESAARACGVEPAAVELRSFDPSSLDPKARKAFPLRLNHFLVAVHRLEQELAFTPRFDLDRGLAHSYANDYSQKIERHVDCSADALLWAK